MHQQHQLRLFCQYIRAACMYTVSAAMFHLSFTHAYVHAAPGAGVAYTRWGHDSCPSVDGTVKIYRGQIAGAFFKQKGGGANYLCLPKNPENDEQLKTAYKNNYSRVYGTEYEHPIAGQHNHGVPCAVCYDSVRSSELMIPAKTKCPAGWTRQYYGYIMSDGNWNDRSRNQYVCVDKEQVSLPGTSKDANGALLYHVRATCHGIQCPPYDSGHALTCVVCTK